MRPTINVANRVLTAIGIVMLIFAAFRAATKPAPDYGWFVVGLVGLLVLYAVSVRIRRAPRGNTIAVIRGTDADAPSARVETSPVRRSDMPGEAQVILEAEGSGAHLWLFQDRVRIKHFGIRGLVTKGFLKGDKEIAIDQISAVQWRSPGVLWLGHIQFSFLGGSGDATIATRDENAVMFSRDQEPAFRAVKEELDRLITASRSERRGLAGDTSRSVIPSQIAELAALRDAGVLTPAEFEAKKLDLLGRM